jgi:phosphoribosyl 1,2-cyclic phosphodiesterase
VQVTFCGTRGSTPAPGADYVRYGGHTSCVALTPDGRSFPTLVLDAGTGLRRVTELLEGRPFDGTILLTHLHWDHVQGLPFFGGGDREGARVSLFLPSDDGTDPVRLLERMMSPPFFPVGPRELRGDWSFSPVPSGSFTADGFFVTALEVPHKGGRTLGYRESDGRATLAYVPDHCPTAVGPGPGGTGECHEAILELVRGVDVLIHDAQLRSEEVAAEASYGHAAAEYAVELGVKAGVRRVALFHHKPSRVDEEVDRTLQRFADTPISVFGAEEGMTVWL